MADVQAQGYAHITICVQDVERSRKFYTETLGMQAVADHPTWVQAGTLRVHLMPTKEIPTVREGFGPHIALSYPIETFRETVERIQANGAVLWREAERSPSTGLWQAFTTDPDGNQVELTDELPMTG